MRCLNGEGRIMKVEIDINLRLSHGGNKPSRLLLNNKPKRTKVYNVLIMYAEYNTSYP